MKIELKVTGNLPKYIKVYTDDKFKIAGHPVYFSEDKKTFKKSRTVIKDSKELRLYEQLYKHISGNDEEKWMLFQLSPSKNKE